MSRKYTQTSKMSSKKIFALSPQLYTKKSGSRLSLNQNHSNLGLSFISDISKSPISSFLRSKKNTQDFKLNNNSGSNIILYPPIQNAPKTKKRLHSLKTKKLVKFKALNTSENNRYKVQVLDENESLKNLNFVTSPTEDKRMVFNISPFSDIVDRELTMYMNQSVFSKNDVETTKNFEIQNKIKSNEFLQHSGTPPPFSIYSKIANSAKRRRLRRVNLTAKNELV